MIFAIQMIQKINPFIAKINNRADSKLKFIFPKEIQYICIKLALVRSR